LPAETLEALVARADGVPLYVEELTKAVAEPGTARGADAIPSTLAGSLMARLDRLSTAKEVAQRAAVLGREFGYPLLAAVAGMDDAGLCQGLTRLVDAEIVFQRGEPPEATYTFKHALVQEAAYESLLKRTRQQLHERVVDVLRERFPERVATEPEVVARHAEAAGRSDDAITYYGRAGERAQMRSAHEEAIGQFRKAIVLLDERERVGITQVKLASRIGSTQPAIARLEGGGSSPSFDTLRRIAAALGLELVVELRPPGPGGVRHRRSPRRPPLARRRGKRVPRRRRWPGRRVLRRHRGARLGSRSATPLLRLVCLV
jgi:transcriptional regulator with XRE-family HTH domain